MKRDILEAEHACTNCNISMQKKRLKIEGMEVRGWQCSKCKDTVLHSEDAQKMLMFNKLRKGLTIKVGVLGQSLIIRLPKEVAEFYHIKKGKDIALRAEDTNKIELMAV